MKICRRVNNGVYEGLGNSEEVRIYIDADDPHSSWIDVAIWDEDKSIQIRGTDKIVIESEAGNCIKIKLKERKKRYLIQTPIDEYTPEICKTDDDKIVNIPICHDTKDPDHPCRCYAIEKEN